VAAFDIFDFMKGNKAAGGRWGLPFPSTRNQREG